MVLTRETKIPSMAKYYTEEFKPQEEKKKKKRGINFGVCPTWICI
jgi:hypothetical protein